MKKSLLIAGSNLRKSKGQAAALIVLILLSAMMLNLWLVLSTDYKQNFDRYHEKTNAAHVLLTVYGEDEDIKDFLKETVENDIRTAEYSVEDIMSMAGSIEYNGGEVNTVLSIYDKDTAFASTVGKIDIIQDSDNKSGIYLPMIYESEKIGIGDDITISIGGDKLTYTVCGFFNNVMMGSHNCSMCQIILTQDKYAELEALGYASKAAMCSVRLNDGTGSQAFESELKSAVSAKYPSHITMSNSYELVSQSRYVSQMICAGIMSAMAFLILLIGLIVISSNIINYINENMKNLGALKAIGYKSGELIRSLLLHFLGLSVIAAAAGIGLSYILFPPVNAMMTAQTGIPYSVHFLPLPFIISLLILCVAVAFVVWLSARRIKKIEPIVALRQGVLTYSFKTNHVPLDKTKAPLTLALALKTTFSGVKNNVTVCITMLVISLIVVFSGEAFENIIVDSKPFVDLIIGERADSCINVNPAVEEEFITKMENDERIEKYYLYNDTESRHVGGIGLKTIISDDFASVNNPNTICEGRFPRYDNEIAIAAKYAKEQKLEIGDEITITADGNSQAYIITGFSQISDNLGKDCVLAREGYEKIGVMTNMSYYIDVKDGVDIEALNSEYKEYFGSDMNGTTNMAVVIDAVSKVYISLMTMIVIVILALSVIVISFVLYLLVRTTLGNKKRDYGVLKALGFTTKQLILQTTLCFMPAVIISTVIGLVVSSFIINPLLAVFLNGVGIVKCTFTVPIGFTVISGIGIIIFAFAAVFLISLKVRKITPRGMLTGE